MSNSGSSSNYEEKFLNILKGSKLLVIDLDGTLINFERVDNIIIREIFHNNKVINIIDRVLWAINRLDVLGNGYAGLKLRLHVYAFLSKQKFVDCKVKYGKAYEKYVRPELYRCLLYTIRSNLR